MIYTNFHCYGRSHQGGRRLLTTLEIESMWICSLLHVIAAVAAPAATADVTVQHVVSPVVHVSKAPGAPTNPAAQIDRSFKPALRGRVGAISEAVLAPGKANNKRRMQKDDIFQKDAAKTRAHLEMIAEMELKNRVKEANEAAKAAEKEEKEAAKAAEKEESERIKDDEEASTDAEDFSHFLEPEIETESATVPKAEAEDFLPMPELLVDTVSECPSQSSRIRSFFTCPNQIRCPSQRKRRRICFICLSQRPRLCRSQRQMQIIFPGQRLGRRKNARDRCLT